ncbi:MAG: N-formylglutamate amidohydrolase [Acetobacteraceae bacterium]|nr:N-formylglutamate amidohydrolase [Acetobacteraceae bacterium]
MDLPIPALALADPPVTVRRPGIVQAPLVFASPHSGRDYSPSFLAASRLDALRLRRSEDSFVDELFADIPALGMPLVTASFPRAWCDANREPWELDPTMFADALPGWVNTASPRVGAGLGTIARVVASGEGIYRGKLRFAEAEARIRACWEPFHAALTAEVEATHARFGACVLIDCHSMPANSLPPRSQVDIVLGDAHGTACAPAVMLAVEQALTHQGFSVRRNDPYAGGFITRHYGRPHQGVHAVQIEINRTLYMDEARIERLGAFAAVRDRLSRAVAAIAAHTAVAAPA